MAAGLEDSTDTLNRFWWCSECHEAALDPDTRICTACGYGYVWDATDHVHGEALGSYDPWHGRAAGDDDLPRDAKAWLTENWRDYLRERGQELDELGPPPPYIGSRSRP